MLLRLDHIAIQVEAENLRNSVAWYVAFFDCTKNWEQFSDFEDLTLQRLPGIRSITELQSPQIKFHLFTRPKLEPLVTQNVQYHHLGFAAECSGILDEMRSRWIQLYNSRKYYFTNDAHVTEKMVDSLGVESLYFTDVNGLEYEVTHIPEERQVERVYPNAK